MKNILLLVLLIPFMVQGQQFELESLGNQSAVLPDDGSAIEQIGYVDFTNNTDFTGVVFVRWTVEEQEPSFMEYKYCWNLCYPYGVAEGSEGLAVTPDQFIEHGLSADFTQQGFAGYYRTNEPGGTVIRHYFYNQSQSLQNYIDIGYCLGETSTDDCLIWNSIEDNAFGKVDFISSPYPNPAKNEARVDYHIKDVSNASYVILNSTGVAVSSEKIEDKTGTLFIDSSELAAGIYIINIMSNGASIGTQRLTVQ